MLKMSKYTGVVIGILFFISLFLVEFGVAGSNVVATYNNGYGTFDMKQYDVQVVEDILSEMSPEGIRVYRFYYLWDFIFVIFFGLFQCYLSRRIYSWWKFPKAKLLVCIIPFIRGGLDIIENVILLKTLYTFPQINATLIAISSVITKGKLLMIRLWILEIIVGIVFGVRGKLHKHEKSGN